MEGATEVLSITVAITLAADLQEIARLGVTMYSDASLAAAISPERLELIILPTEKCNFRCTYCYEDFSLGKMKQPVVDGIKALIRNRVPHLRHLALSWFGGEPLLASDLVTSISSYAKDLCTTHGVSFAGGLTTNGYLLEHDLFERLVSLGQTSFQITLDGDEEWHDQTRIQANRRPNFRKIWNNLESCTRSAASYQISLRLHLHQENVDSMRRLYERLKQSLLVDKRFSASFHKVGALGQQSGSGPRLLSRGAYKEALDYVRADDSTEVPASSSELELEDYVCYAAKPNSLMVRANGTIGKCTVILDDPRNNLGRIHPDGTLDIDNTKLRRWMLGFLDTSKPTLSCPLSSLPQESSSPPIPIVDRLAD